MINIQEHLIYKEASIKEAMNQINKLPKTLTLFVINEYKQLIGTLTDGDIRRGLIEGKKIEDQIINIMKEDYFYLYNTINVREIKRIKQLGIKLLPVLDKNHKIIKIFDLHLLTSILPLEAVIMAGGKGERLKPFTNNIPKPMLKIGSKPIIEYTVDHLISYGIDKIYISVNYLKDQIIEHFKDGSKKGIEIEYIEEEKPLGTAGSLSLIKNTKKDILLTNSDLFTNIDYENLYLAFYNKKADLAIASVPYTINIPYAILEEKENHQVVNFKEKPSNTHYANAGIYILKKSLIQDIPKNKFFNVTDLLKDLLNTQKNIIHNPLIGYWIDIGKHEDLNKAREIIKHIT